MKKFIIIILGAIFTIQALPALASETNIVYQKVLQASNDIPKLIKVLPEVEKLWPEDPDSYLKSVSHASHVLGGRVKNSNAKKAFVNLFVGMMQKSCPTNQLQQATAWIKLKNETVQYFLGFEQIRDNKSTWLEVAKFIGEIRSKIIPDYRNQNIMISDSIIGPGAEERIKKELEENEKGRIPDDFQRALQNANGALIALMQVGCPFFYPNASVDENFKKQIISAAHLSVEEAKELQKD